MTTEWRDPDTGLVHHIFANSRIEAEAMRRRSETLVEVVREETFAHQLGIVIDQIAREVTMSCGKKVRVDRNDCIMPEGEALLYSLPPILRPWLVIRETPTCLWCVKMDAEKDRHVGWWAYEMQGTTYP